MTPRAPAMSVDERRASLIDAAIPLLIDRGAAASTKEIAAAAGVAEGTIFRVFDTKDDLVTACVRHAVDTGRVRAELAEVDRTLPLEDRLVAAVTVLQAYTRRIISLMVALHASGQSARRHDGDQAAQAEVRERQRREIDDDLVDLVGDDSGLLRHPARRVIDTLRALTFASAHPMMGGGPSTPADIVDTVLHGALRRDVDTGGTRPPSARPDVAAGRGALAGPPARGEGHPPAAPAVAGETGRASC